LVTVDESVFTIKPARAVLKLERAAPREIV
jgi:hypothetical protein